MCPGAPCLACLEASITAVQDTALLLWERAGRRHGGFNSCLAPGQGSERSALRFSSPSWANTFPQTRRHENSVRSLARPGICARLIPAPRAAWFDTRSPVLLPTSMSQGPCVCRGRWGSQDYPWPSVQTDEAFVESGHFLLWCWAINGKGGKRGYLVHRAGGGELEKHNWSVWGDQLLWFIA